MGSARKYLALALTACRTKHYEEAGVFLAQASSEEDAEELAAELGRLTEGSQEEVAAECSETADAATVVAVPSATEDLDWDDADDEESVSSTTRRKTTTKFQIGKILAASMSSADEELDESEDEEDEDTESDPDFEGEALIPASFSSIQVKSLEINSPIKFKQ